MKVGRRPVARLLAQWVGGGHHVVRLVRSSHIPTLGGLARWHQDDQSRSELSSRAHAAVKFPLIEVCIDSGSHLDGEIDSDTIPSFLIFTFPACCERAPCRHSHFHFSYFNSFQLNWWLVPRRPFSTTFTHSFNPSCRNVPVLYQGPWGPSVRPA